MKKNRTFLAICTLFIGVLFVASCDDDLSPLGGEIIGGNNFDTNLFEETDVVSYSLLVNPTQTNALPVYQLGIYNDPIYGQTTSSVLSQVILNTVNPDFGENPEIESVILSIPFFSTDDIVSEETNDFILDSVYGNTMIKLSIYESTYFLRDFDPEAGFEEPQKYYSNQGPLFEGFLGDLIYQDIEFLPSSESIIINEGEDDEQVLSPRIRVELPIDFFTELILDMEGSSELSSVNNFKDYFRGMFFKAEALTPDGVLMLIDFAEASINIEYTFDGIDVADQDGDGDTTETIRLEDEIGLTFGGNVVNVIETEYPAELLSELADVDIEEGEETIYLKGGQGVMTLIDLFGEDTDGDGEADQLTALKENNWLINEANLIFYVDQDKVTGGDLEPERIFIYDLDNRRVLIDYDIDNTFAEATIDFKGSHLGRIVRDSDENGVSYRIRLTTHISNLLRKDSTNVRLGLVVSQNVLSTTLQGLETPQDPGIEGVPTGSVISPEGTVLFGSATLNEAKRLKLKIYYTEPN